MIFISGPTSSAKTSSVLIAAAICGDTNHSVVWSSGSQRVRQALQEAKSAGSFVTFNEINKEGKAAGRSIVQAMQFILNLTPDSLSHKLYVGPVRLGHPLPVCVWTDTEMPESLAKDAQLARRLIHIYLGRRIEWTLPMRNRGLSKIGDLRFLDPAVSHACDIILSSVIDAHFRTTSTFEEIARSLGFAPLEDRPEALEVRETQVEFFDAVCAAPPISGPDASRWKGRGWKLIRQERDTTLNHLWEQLCDEGYSSSERCNEQDWASLLGVDGPILFESRAHGLTVAVRFIRRLNRTVYEVNEELR
jgi:hypothetical protein